MIETELRMTEEFIDECGGLEGKCIHGARGNPKAAAKACTKPR